MTPKRLLLFSITIAWVTSIVQGYEFGLVDRRSLAGLWKLSPRSTPILKEFTTYPKPNKQNLGDTNTPDLLLVLNEDGSFHQFSNDGDDEENKDADLDRSWGSFQASRQSSLTAVQQGVWDLVDGNLILAADRPDKERIMDIKEKLPDTLLEGQVVVSSSTRMSTPSESSETAETATGQTGKNGGSAKKAGFQKSPAFGSRSLSVPFGSIKVGRFFYPKTHPSFFEQPMFRPQSQGAFELRQVIGASSDLSGSRQEDVDENMFYRDDFYNKTFLLTSHPIAERKPKGKKRWSIKFNRYVYDPPKKEAQEAADEAARNNILKCKVTRIQFYPNGTFCTQPLSMLGGGDGADDDDGGCRDDNPTILRGKYDVMGPQNSQLWFQVWRFGFGRSVSGSTYSQGRMLTQDDAKTYWGTIVRHNGKKENRKNEEDNADQDEESAINSSSPDSSISADQDGSPAEQPERLEIQGSVLFGAGLEPLPVGRFIMREIDDDDTDFFEDEDDDEEEVTLRVEASLEDSQGIPDEGIDWSANNGFE